MKKLVALVAVTLLGGLFGGLWGGSPAVLAQEAASYVLKVDAPSAKTGQRSVAKIKITPGAGFHMNKEYPTSLVMSGVPAGVTVDKPKQTAKDAAKFEEAGAEFDVAYTAAQPGKKMVTGEIKFAVCSANTCDPKKSSVSFQIDVK